MSRGNRPRADRLGDVSAGVHNHRVENDDPSPAAVPRPAPLSAEQQQITETDRQVVAEQLGRQPRAMVAIAARCTCGRPLVVRTAPRLEDGTPFPTTYYLTHPAAVKAVSTLESSGIMAEMTNRLREDPALAEAHRRAHEDYLARRAELGEVPEIAGVSAGGMPGRVKCLHVLVAHSMATAPGINPLGDEALQLIAHQWRPDVCSCEPTDA